jgi:hypothetical protein
LAASKPASSKPSTARSRSSSAFATSPDALPTEVASGPVQVVPLGHLRVGRKAWQDDVLRSFYACRGRALG